MGDGSRLMIRRGMLACRQSFKRRWTRSQGQEPFSTHSKAQTDTESYSESRRLGEKRPALSEFRSSSTCWSGTKSRFLNGGLEDGVERLATDEWVGAAGLIDYLRLRR